MCDLHDCSWGEGWHEEAALVTASFLENNNFGAPKILNLVVPDPRNPDGSSTEPCRGRTSFLVNTIVQRIMEAKVKDAMYMSVYNSHSAKAAGEIVKRIAQVYPGYSCVVSGTQLRVYYGHKEVATLTLLSLANPNASRSHGASEVYVDGCEEMTKSFKMGPLVMFLQGAKLIVVNKEGKLWPEKNADKLAKYMETHTYP